MKGRLIALVSATVLTAATALASNIDFGINVNIGNPPPPAPPPIVIEQPPQFIVPSSLGFFVAVGIPYDLFYISNSYYVFRGNTWYYGPRYNGPWRVISYQRLPAPLRRHEIERIRYFRDEEYRVYGRDREHYRGRYFRPEFEGKGRHHGGREGYEGRGHGHEGRGHDE